MPIASPRPMAREPLLGSARKDRGRSFGAGLTQAEVDYMRDAEWAQTADDVLWRRSKLGLLVNEAQRSEIEDYLS